MYRAKIDFLWYKRGQEIDSKEDNQNIIKWIKLGLVEDVPRQKEEVKPVVKEEVKEEIKPKKSSKKKRK